MSGVFRVNKSKDFSSIKNEPLRDARLSFGARGILAYLLTKPDDWQVRSCDLVAQSPHGKDAILSMLKELEDCGYLKRERVRDETGRYQWQTEVFETPQAVAPKEDSPKRDFPAQVKPDREKPATKERLSEERLNKEREYKACAQKSETQSLGQQPVHAIESHHPAPPQTSTQANNLQSAVLDALGSRLRFEMGSFAPYDKAKLTAFVAYLEASNRTPADVAEFTRRLPLFFKKPNPSTPLLETMIKIFDTVLAMDTTPQAPKPSRYPQPTCTVADAATTQAALETTGWKAAREARRRELAGTA